MSLLISSLVSNYDEFNETFTKSSKIQNYSVYVVILLNMLVEKRLRFIGDLNAQEHLYH